MIYIVEYVHKEINCQEQTIYSIQLTYPNMYITQGNRKNGLKIAYVDRIDLLWIEIAPKRLIFGSTGALRGN